MKWSLTGDEKVAYWVTGRASNTVAPPSHGVNIAKTTSSARRGSTGIRNTNQTAF